MIYIIIAICFYLAVVFFKGKLQKHSGDTIYLDDGRAKTFYSRDYGIAAKPDELLSLPTGQIALKEFKSRWEGIYSSDKAQIIASAIAARDSGYDVRSGLLETRSGKEYKVNLSGSSDSLYKRIADNAEQARMAISGVEPNALPARGKCPSCPYKRSCRYALI